VKKADKTVRVFEFPLVGSVERVCVTLVHSRSFKPDGEWDNI